MNEGKQNTALLRVLQIFERYTDENHLLTHNGIVAILEKEFQINVSLNAMEYWVMQYINYVKVLSSIALIDRIRANLKAVSTKYDL